MRKLSEETFTVFDLETTGGRPETNGILEIGMVKVRGNQLIDRYATLVNPCFPIPPIVRRMTGINDEMVINAPLFQEIADPILNFVDCDILVVHNGPFDLQFLNYYLQQTQKITLLNPLLCTVKLGERLLPDAPNRRLETLAQYLDLPFPGRHRAWGDAEVTAQLFITCLRRLEEQGIETLGQLTRWLYKPMPKPTPAVDAAEKT